MITTRWDERERVEDGWALKPARERVEQNGGGKEGTRLPGFVCKATEKKMANNYVMVLCLELNPGLSHLPIVTIEISPNFHTSDLLDKQ